MSTPIRRRIGVSEIANIYIWVYVGEDKNSGSILNQKIICQNYFY